MRNRRGRACRQRGTGARGSVGKSAEADETAFLPPPFRSRFPFATRASLFSLFSFAAFDPRSCLKLCSRRPRTTASLSPNEEDRMGKPTVKMRATKNRRVQQDLDVNFEAKNVRNRFPERRIIGDAQLPSPRNSCLLLRKSCSARARRRQILFLDNYRCDAAEEECVIARVR